MFEKELLGMFDFRLAKKHPKYPWILVDPKGLIWNAETGHLYKLIENRKDGYYRISIRQKPRRIRLMVHKLIAEVFVENPNNLKEINHIDGIKINNHWENLEWCTHSENLKHAYDNGLIRKNE
jgi:hypothetical protein